MSINQSNPFHYQNVQLNKIIVYRNGLPIAGILVSMTDNKRKYYNTMEALDFVFNNSHGTNLANYHNHYIKPFDLTSFQDASHDFIHTELTNCISSVNLKFYARLGENLDTLFMGEPETTISIAKITLMNRIGKNVQSTDY